MNSTRIVVTGAAGQLGQTLLQLWHSKPLSKQFEFLALDRSKLDIVNPECIETTLSSLKPAIIVNTAAYTQVDRAESDRDSAYLANDTAVANLVRWAARNESRLIHISTDFVFDGTSETPYLPDHRTAPLGVYGHSKLAGEKQLEALPIRNAAIIRTSWLYSEYGSNFVKTIIRLMDEKDELAVVSDQIGSPSSTHGLAELIFAMVLKQQYQGVYHWNDGGSISWFEFAEVVQRLALQHNLLNRQIPIKPITTSDYPTAAARPAYSVLDRSRAMAEFDCPVLDWEQQLDRVIRALAAQRNGAN